MVASRQVSTSRLRAGGLRLDGGYYCSIGEDARRLLESFALQVETVGEVSDRIFIGGRGRRVYVQPGTDGVPFLSSSDILLADLAGVPMVNPRMASLDLLVLKHGWSLISRSGTIGNTAYTNANLAGKAASEHVMKVVPNARILPGYLYAWLSSVPGIALVKQGTFGSVIPTIEPDYVASLPVPRLPDGLEATIHGNIEMAAAKRVEANRRLQEADLLVEQMAGLPTQFGIPCDHGFSTGVVRHREIRGEAYRLDAYHYIGYSGEVRCWESGACSMLTLSEITLRIFEPPIFTRVRAVDGVPYCLGAEVYEAHPRPSTRIARGTPSIGEYLLLRDMVVVQDAGQRYGLLGTPAYIGRTLDGCAATNNMIRFVCRTREDSAFLYALLRSQFGIRSIRRLSYGTSLPHILPKQVGNIEFPWPTDERQRQLVAQPVLNAIELRDQANDHEDEAQAMLERALNDATNGAWSHLAHSN